MDTTYLVSGMTCGHCVSSVQGEIGKIGGVSAVEVDLASGEVRVTSDQPLDLNKVRSAVDEAGYALVESSAVEG
jgi:copper chaperone